jgi:hypothetical protein
LLLHNARKYVNKTIIDNKDEKKKEVSPFLTLVAKNFYWISSVIVGSIFISLEVLFSATYTYSKQYSSTDATISGYLALTGLTVVPLFMMFGLPIVVTSKLKIRNKMLLFPILAAVPVCGAVPIYLLSESLNITSMTFCLFLGPPIGVFFWLGLAMVYTARRRMFYFMMTFGCVFILIPLFILGLLGENPQYSTSFTSFINVI